MSVYYDFFLTMNISSAAITDIGRVRRQNEDRFLCSEDQRLFGVADGIGGLPGGAIAAQLSIDSMRSKLDSDSPKSADALITAVQQTLSLIHI